MWLTALLMGMAGSLHCAGMCSPLVMAVTAGKPFRHKLFYNLGRIFIYGVMGLMVGEVGSFIQITKFQQGLSLALGGVLLLMGLGAIRGIKIPILTTVMHRFNSWLRQLFGQILQQKNNASVLTLGLLNGLLPCGLTYLALTYCLTLDHAWQGFLFMVIFGLGTFPVMLGMTWVLGITAKRFQFKFQRITTVVFLVLGSLLIVRATFNHDNSSKHNTQTELKDDKTLCR